MQKDKNDKAVTLFTNRRKTGTKTTRFKWETEENWYEFWGSEKGKLSRMNQKESQTIEQLFQQCSEMKKEVRSREQVLQDNEERLKWMTQIKARRKETERKGRNEIT